LNSHNIFNVYCELLFRVWCNPAPAGCNSSQRASKPENFKPATPGDGDRHCGFAAGLVDTAHAATGAPGYWDGNATFMRQRARAMENPAFLSGQGSFICRSVEVRPAATLDKANDTVRANG
jgi:hypothetical protein